MNSIFCFIFLYGKTADYTDGETGYGIVGTLVLFGVIYLIAKIWPSSNNNQQDNVDNNYYDYNPVDDYELEEPDIDDDVPIIDLDEDLDFSHVNTYTNNSVSHNVKEEVKEEVKNEDIISEEMKKECIRIYGDYGEIVGIKDGGISIKEDGEYRLIKGNDWRYKILFRYIFDNRYEMYIPANMVSDHELLHVYSMSSDEEILPPAKPMEQHGKLEKEYLGGLIISLKAYVWADVSKMGRYIYSSRPITLKEFLFSIGFDKAVYLYKYIGKPMEWSVYWSFRNMQIKGMTTQDFLSFEKTYGLITSNSDGYFTHDGKFLGKNHAAVDQYMKEQMPFTFDQARQEVMERDWHL